MAFDKGKGHPPIAGRPESGHYTSAERDGPSDGLRGSRKTEWGAEMSELKLRLPIGKGEERTHPFIPEVRRDGTEVQTAQRVGHPRPARVCDDLWC